METLVLVLTDVQGSTRLWQDEPVAMDAAMARHHEIVHGAVAEHGGFRPVDQGEGDAVFAAFSSPTAAMAAVVQVQRLLAAEPWPTSVPLRVRIGVHVGEVTQRSGNLFGDPVNRCARLRGLGAGGQTLLSAPVYELVRDKLPAATTVIDLGEHRMKDLVRPEHVWQLDLEGLPAAFPPLASLDRVLHNLPVQPSPLIGRETELAAALAALGSHRLVTLTGFGGMGKTRLSLQVAAELADGDGDGVWFVDLASTTDPAAVPGLVGRATGLGGSDGDSVIEALSGQRLLLVLDNLEQVMGCTSFVADLLARVPGVKVLATSREPLRLRGEQELALSPLALPPPDGPQDAASLSAYSAVQLFVERAVAVRAAFEVTNENAPAVAAICQRLDGHPLAIELAAARVRMMTPQALLPRLDQALALLTGGSRDLPGRHQTLRATIAWSYNLLDEPERLLLDRMSVFVGPVAFEHVEAVCTDGNLDVFEALASLVEKSLVRTSVSDDGDDRYGLLVSIKAYAAEQLDQAGQTQALRDRHCDHFQQAHRWPPPATGVEMNDRVRRAVGEVDELVQAWEQVLAAGDPQRTARFPFALAHAVLELGDRERAVSLYAAIVDAAAAPSAEAAEALGAMLLLEWEAGIEIGSGRREQLDAIAEALDRPDVRFIAAVHERAGISPDERQSYAARVQAMAAAAAVAGGIWAPEHVSRLADNATFTALLYVDPPRALVAAQRCWESPSREVLDVANYGRALHEAGRHDEALVVTAPRVSRGVVRLDPTAVHYAHQVHAWALLALGRPAEAVSVMDVWHSEVERRGWPGERRRQAGVRVWALLQQGRLEEAAQLVTGALPIAVLWYPQIQVLQERTERLTARLHDHERLPALIEQARPGRYDALHVWMCLLVEQALRVTGDEQRRLLEEVVAEQRGIYLPFGYQEDLDRLLADL